MCIFRVRSAFLPHGVSLLSIRISHRAPKNSHNTATKGPSPKPNAHSLESAQERCQSGSLSQLCARVETNLVGLQAVHLSPPKKWLAADLPLNHSNGPPYLHHFTRVKFTYDARVQPFEEPCVSELLSRPSPYHHPHHDPVLNFEIISPDSCELLTKGMPIRADTS